MKQALELEKETGFNLVSANAFKTRRIYAVILL